MSADPLAAVLVGARPPGVYRLAATEPADAIATRLSAAGWGCPVLDGHAAHDKASMLRACQAALRLPDWFGHNWDALHDSLIDLSWLPGLGQVVLWESAGTLLAADPPTWRTACDVFAAAAVVRAELGLSNLVLALRGVDVRSGVALPPPL
jgi:hypothetical protein